MRWFDYDFLVHACLFSFKQEKFRLEVNQPTIIDVLKNNIKHLGSLNSIFD